VETFGFIGKLWKYPGKAAWFFITLPADVGAQIKFFTGKAKGFGSVRVKARIGNSTWKTSVFPDSKSGSYFLPVKAAVRSAERISAGDDLEVNLTLDL
jgi:Domain of unknown function (DUF1905)